MTEPAKLCVRVAALTHVGLRRRANEDCIAVDGRILCEPMERPEVSCHRLDGPSAFAVADGMGGHPAGEVASRSAIEFLVSHLDGTGADRARVADLLRDTNRFLFEEMARCPQWYGMGTTLAGVVASAERLIAFNVGDSRVYRIEDGGLEQVSVDDSEAVNLGFLFNRVSARVLSQCLGGFPESGGEIFPHVAELALRPGSRFLVCSDGLYDMLSDSTIARCLDEDPERSVQTLFEAAMAEGGVDNISIVLGAIEADTAG